MEVVTVPVLSDNYSYLLIDAERHVAAAIDPVEPEAVLAAAAQHKVQITHILTTHSHWDHAGGNAKLVKLLESHGQKSIPVIGGLNDKVEACNHEVGAGDMIQVGNLNIKVYYVPCHTPGHVLYHCQDALFTGDTLFIAGCGNLNAGTPAQMHNALNEQIAVLPPATRVFVGHEYTANNLKFAATVEPSNEAIQRKLEWALEKATSKSPTVPSTVKEELETNPFMRVHLPSLQDYTNATDAIEVLRIVRERKNKFRAVS